MMFICFPLRVLWLDDPARCHGALGMAASNYSLTARIETLFTPYFFVAPWAFSETNWY
jgi:hypothetical protein